MDAVGSQRTALFGKDLVAGAGITFIDRGTRALKGVPGKWRLFAVNGTPP
jgi:hypothetical protein